MQDILTYFQTNGDQFLTYVREHLTISLLALLMAAAFAVPAGILASKTKALKTVTTGFWQTLRLIPSLAVLVLLIPFTGTGVLPAVIALTVLAVPPILLNTITGFRSVPADVIEAAKGMGMPSKMMFWSVKLPLAMPLIFTGIQSAAVETIASATLAAYVGAGGLGTLIFTGLGLLRTDLLWIGGVSVAVLSLGTGWLLGLVQKRLRKHEKPALAVQKTARKNFSGFPEKGKETI